MTYFFTLKCHLRVKIQIFSLARFARSDFKNNYYIFSKEAAAKKHYFLFLT